MKNYRGFYLKIFEFLELKSSIYLNRHVFVLSSQWNSTCAHAFSRNWQVPCWNSNRERMTIENISWCRTRRESNPRPPDLWSNAHPTDITKTYLYNFDPLKSHFYVVKLGFTLFFISAQKHRLWYSLEPLRRGGSNDYPQYMFWAEIWKISIFYLKTFNFFRWNFLYIGIGVFSKWPTSQIKTSTLCMHQTKMSTRRF